MSLRGGVAAALLSTVVQSETSQDTPITRVVGLLNDMKATLESDMEEDEGLYLKLHCWCKSNAAAKASAQGASNEKIAELKNKIESLTSGTALLAQQIEELEAAVADNKAALDEATATRKKQLAKFQSTEDASIQAIENMKAAIIVLSKHEGNAFPQMPPSFLATNSKETPWTDAHEASHVGHAMDEFMSQNEDFFDHAGDEILSRKSARKSFLAHGQNAAHKLGVWSSHENTVVHDALQVANVFLQAHGRERYMPSYDSQSGEILGVMRQLQAEMKAELAEAQTLEGERVASFVELRKAKSDEIASGEKRAEEKEDELATGNNDLAEAKEDLQQEGVVLGDAEEFSKNLAKTCADADAAFAERKKGRLEEINAVSETIGILTADEARDTFTSTYKFVQVVARRSTSSLRSATNRVRRAALVSADPRLAMLATTMELDAFTKVKAAIDKMIATLKAEQADEVTKNDYCKDTIQSTEMSTAKAQDYLGDLQAKEAELEVKIENSQNDILAAQAGISDAHVNLQRATEDRKADNDEYTHNVNDQKVTVAILKKALDKLATFYDEAFVQIQHQQTPPVPQMEYKKNSGAGGIMSMIEKLIGEAQKMTTDAHAAENEAQVAYGTLVADTNAGVKAFEKEIVSKTKTKAQATKDKKQTADDILAALKELEGLSKGLADLHVQCDYVLKNFGARQGARSAEIEALQQAKQILNGANLS